MREVHTAGSHPKAAELPARDMNQTVNTVFRQLGSTLQPSDPLRTATRRNRRSRRGSRAERPPTPDPDPDPDPDPANSRFVPSCLQSCCGSTQVSFHVAHGRLFESLHLKHSFPSLSVVLFCSSEHGEPNSGFKSRNSYITLKKEVFLEQRQLHLSLTNTRKR